MTRCTDPCRDPEEEEEEEDALFQLLANAGGDSLGLGLLLFPKGDNTG